MKVKDIIKESMRIVKARVAILKVFLALIVVWTIPKMVDNQMIDIFIALGSIYVIHSAIQEYAKYYIGIKSGQIETEND